VVGFDTETDALSSTHAGLCGVSLAVGPNEACYIPLTHEHEPTGDGGLDFGDGGDARPPLLQIDKPTALARLKALLEDPSVLKVGQNIKYDLAVMARRGVRVAPIDDVMLISYVLEGGLHGHGMDELARLHLGHEPMTFKSVAGTGQPEELQARRAEIGRLLRRRGCGRDPAPASPAEAASGGRGPVHRL